MIAANDAKPGYAIEVLQEAARREGREVEITFVPFERAMLALRTETDVIMPALFFGKKHNDQFQWLVEIQRARLRFATSDGQIVNLEDARRLTRIAIESGTTAEAMLSELGYDNTVLTVSPESSARMLAAGRVDAWFQAEENMRQVWNRLGITTTLSLGEIAREVPIYLVASTALREDVADSYRSAVEDMRADGTLDAIWRFYTEDEVLSD